MVGIPVTGIKGSILSRASEVGSPMNYRTLKGVFEIGISDSQDPPFPGPNYRWSPIYKISMSHEYLNKLMLFL